MFRQNYNNNSTVFFIQSVFFTAGLGVEGGGQGTVHQGSRDFLNFTLSWILIHIQFNHTKLIFFQRQNKVIAKYLYFAPDVVYT